MLTSGVENVAYDARRNLAARKRPLLRIGPRASFRTIVRSSSTSAPPRGSRQGAGQSQGLLVITNNIHVATILMPRQGIDVILAGGMLRKSDGGAYGRICGRVHPPVQGGSRHHWCPAIDDDGAMLDFDYHEVGWPRPSLQNARSVMLVADAMKFTRTAPVRIGHLSDIDTFVTTLRLPNRLSTSAGHQAYALRSRPKLLPLMRHSKQQNDP